MNQFFDQKRFSLLVLKHWADNKKRYTLSLLAYMGLLITWFLFGLIIEGIPEGHGLPEEIQLTTFFFSLFAVGTFYASQYFSDLGSREKGSHLLLVPASSFEKLLCSLFFTVIVFPILMIACFYLVDVSMVTIANSFSGGSISKGKSTVANIFEAELIRFNTKQTIYLLLFFFSVQSLFLLGSAYFKKYNFIKTIITGFLVFVACFFLVYVIAEHIVPEEKEDYYFLKIEKWFPTFLQALAYSTAPIAWVATYFVLKAKQV
ncbi:MAG TPA: hypothetical protein VFR58_14635 [Flavisolibacter sp.]|nr:hypothetical protein [Flavisolibacter sp.]